MAAQPVQSSSMPTASATLVGSHSSASGTSAAKQPKPTKVAKVTNAAITGAAGALGARTEISNIWREVLKDYLAKLNDADRRLCVPLPCHVKIDQRSLEATFATIRPRYESGAFYKFLDKVNPINEHVQSFGRAIDVAVGGGDLGAGLVWGGITILLSVSTRTMSLHGKIVDYLETLSSYLPLFERWTKIFHPNDYTELAACIKRTCVEFFNYLVDSIQFFRKSAFVNFFKVWFNPKFESRFKSCQDRIDRQTKHLTLELSTAGLEDSKQRDTSIMALIQTSASKQTVGITVTFPLRFVQNAPRNDQFFGREDCLVNLDTQLRPDSKSKTQRMRSVVIYGLGGSGKSSVAKEYMYREYNAGKYEVILWTYADSKDKLETQFIALARHLGIKAVESEARHAVLSWINNLEKEFLLVFDNADDPSFLKPYWPHTVRGSVLITSRNPKTQEEGFAKSGIPLKAWDDSEGSKFLKSMLPSGFQKDDDDEKAITLLSQKFGGLPLALRQAGSFMKNKNCNPSKFLRIYQQRFEDIDSYQVEGYDRTVATTWTVSTSGLSEDSRILLDALSLLDPDSISTEIFDVSDFGHSYAKFLDDPLSTVNAQEGLTQQSLVDYDHNSKSLSIHRHLQHITFSRLSKDHNRLRNTTDFILHLINKYVPEIGFTAVRYPHNWKYVEKTLSHVQSVYGRCKDILTEGTSAMMLICMTKVLCYAFESAQYPLGDWAYEQGVELAKRISEPNHEVMSLMYLLFSRLCGEMSRSQEGLDASIEAEKHIMIAAEIKPDLLKTGQYLRILTNLGIMYTDLENWDEALKWHNMAVDTCIQLGMQKEFSLGNLRQNLAGTYLWKGDLKKAEEVVRQSLTEPNTSPMGATFTLGNVLWKQNRLDEAVTVHKQTLHDYSESLGANHPVTADSWRKMGSLFAMPNYSGYDLEESERCYRQAYNICKTQAVRQNNNSNSYLAIAQWSLASVLEKIGPQHQEECQKLKKEAMDYLNLHFKGDIPQGKDISEVFESIMFYWSR